MENYKETYIGDGVYVTKEGEMIKLWTPRLNGDHFIYLGSNEIANLLIILKLDPEYKKYLVSAVQELV